MNDIFPLISIQILSWNRAEETVRAIYSAINQTYPSLEIVVIDNNSDDNSVQLISDTFPNIKLIKLDKNYGCPGGRNRGIIHCNGEFIFYLDNDGVLHSDAVREAYNIMKEDKMIAVVAGVVRDFDVDTEIDVDCVKPNIKPYIFNNFQGGVTLHRKSIYIEVGSYPDHFMYGAEEMFLTYRIIDKGYKVVKNPRVILWHRRSQLARNRSNELIHAYNNKLYTALVLYPLQYAVSFAFYFYLTYWYYASKEGILLPFLKSLVNKTPNVFVKAIKDRSPISHSSYKKIKRR